MGRLSWIIQEANIIIRSFEGKVGDQRGKRFLEMQHTCFEDGAGKQEPKNATLEVKKGKEMDYLPEPQEGA